MSKFSKFLRHIRHTAMAAAAAATYSSLSLAQRPTAQRLNKNKVFTIESFQGSRAYHHHMFWLSTTSNFCLFFFFKSCLAGYLSYKEIAFFHLSAAARAFGGNIFAHFCYHYTTVDAIALLTKCIFFFFFMCVCVDSGYFDFVDFQIIYFFSFLLAHENLCDHFCSAGPESHTKVIQPSVLLRSCAGWEVGGGVGIQACWRALGDSSIITRHKRTSLPKSLYSTFIIFFVGRNTILFREKQVTEKMDANSHPSSLSLYGVAGSYALQKERKQVVCLLFSNFLFLGKCVHFLTATDPFEN